MKFLPLVVLSSLLILTSCLDVDDNDLDYDNSEDIAFLEDNAQEEDVTVTESGLQYRVIEEGDGDIPTDESNVRVHYTGTFIDGEVFDSTHDREEPAEFNVRGVIDGFSEGLQLMQEGAIYELVLPAELAYGDTGSGPIYPGATVIFEVELLEIL